MKVIREPSSGKTNATCNGGPNTNREILELIEALRDEKEYPPLECIGSCGLHIISDALHTGVKAADWLIEKFLWAMFKIL